jgi:uncharacterized protein YbaR (Trm112 family)
MVSPDLLELLRCPMDPRREARLEDAGDHLTCTRCRLEFPIRDGIPSMLVEEAKLPPGCASPADLPCQHESAPAPGPAAPQP